MPKGVKAEVTIKEGDKVFVVNDATFEVIQTTVYSAPSEIIFAKGKGYHPVAYGPQRWAKTKAEAEKKALALATNRRAELTDKLSAIDATIKKLGGK